MDSVRDTSIPLPDGGVSDFCPFLFLLGMDGQLIPLRWKGGWSSPSIVLGYYGGEDSAGVRHTDTFEFCLANFWLGYTCQAGQAVNAKSGAPSDPGPSNRGAHSASDTRAVWGMGCMPNSSSEGARVLAALITSGEDKRKGALVVRLMRVLRQLPPASTSREDALKALASSRVTGAIKEFVMSFYP